MAPAKIQAFILNQIIISVTYTQYCMAVGGQCSSTQTQKPKVKMLLQWLANGKINPQKV